MARLRMKSEAGLPHFMLPAESISEEWVREMYYDRIETIKREVPSDRLIVWELGVDGWEPLAITVGFPSGGVALDAGRPRGRRLRGVSSGDSLAPRYGQLTPALDIP